ncbi:MAG: AAA family ATPase, partial [Chloroflexota bacterium]
MHHHLTPQFILDKWANGEQNGRFPAVTLFLDLSGFTPLCAHLRQYGKAGAEELAKLMDQIFHPLIGSIYAHDGFVAGFAGDAFKAVFPTLRPESHVAALAAAQQIRAAMVANEEIATPFGSFTLTSRTSLASGEVSWRIWTAEEGAAYGQSQAYTFAGDALDAAIAGELLAEAGGLVMTQTVYEVLQPLVNLTAVPHLNHNYFTLTAVHAPLPQHPTPPAPATTSPVGNFYPATLLTQRTPGEFRHVISLFLNIEEPDSKETDSAFMTTFFRLLHQYGGFLCRIGRGGASEAGRTFVLFWGAPTARENDIDRALNFMLDLQTAVSPATRMRAGLTYQMVYAGFVGSPLCEEYTCYGLHVNLAARLMVTSPWGEIWLDEAVATHAQEGFRVAFADKRPFKGFAAPLNVYRLESIKLDPLTSFFQREMVGRASEMEQLQTAVQPIFNNNFGGLITVAGEAGIGKSRLVHQFLDQLASQQSFTLLRCQTDEILRESLNPFRYSLRYYFAQHPTQSEAENKANFDSKFSQLIDHTKEAALRTELIRTRSFLGALVDLQWPDSLYESLEPNLRQENSFIALKSLIQAESLRQPLIVQLEDSHWLDEDSARFLRELTHDAAAHPFLILSTTRDVEAHSPATEVPYHLVLLDMLPAGEVNQLAEKLLQTAVSPELITFLMNRTEGNPFFVEQMVLYLQEQQLLEPSTAGVVAKTAVSDLPDTIQAILIARIDRLSQAVREVVQTAAVLGREFDVQVLSAMLQGEATVSEKIKTAESAAIWSALSELRYLFRHALLRDAAYWDPAKGRADKVVADHRLDVHSVACLPAERVVSASGDRTIRLWDLSTSRTMVSVSEELCMTVTRLPDGRIVSVSAEGRVRVWDEQSQQTVAALRPHAGIVMTVTALPGGRLATASEGPQVAL